MTGSAQFTVFSNSVPGREDELRAWYRDVHLVDARLIPGVVSASLYEWQPVEGRPPSDHTFMAVYEVAGDPVTVWGEFDRRIAEGVMATTDALDGSSLSFAVWDLAAPEQA